MAILVEEEKKPTNWAAVASTLVVVVALFVGSYLLFFKKPELLDITTPGSLKDLNSLSKISFNPDDVINAPTFKLLRQFGTNVSTSTAGRSNPFKPF